VQSKDQLESGRKKPRVRRNWKWRVLNALEMTGKISPVAGEMCEATPLWVERIGRELSKQVYGCYPYDKWDEMDALDLGRVLGGQYSIFADYAEFVKNEKLKKRISQTAGQWKREQRLSKKERMARRAFFAK